MNNIPIDQITNTEFELGEKDNHLIELVKKQIQGEISSDSIVINMNVIEPFCKTLKSSLNHNSIDSFKDRIISGDFPSMLVYYKNGKFIMSDDYHTYYAYLELKSEKALCEVLGDIPDKYFSKNK